MCRIGAIKSREPVSPALALRLMQPQQEGHDNSGFALVMQDLQGVFSHYKDKPRRWPHLCGRSFGCAHWRAYEA